MIDYRYWAGFLDGEGCFYVDNECCIRVSVSNTYKPIIQRLKKEVGGSFSLCIDHRLAARKNRRFYSWHVNSSSASIFIRSVLPYLREKRAQAKLLLKFHNLPKGVCAARPVPNSTKIKRAQILKELKRLKHISY